MLVYDSKEKISNSLFHGCLTALVGLDFLTLEVSRSHPVRQLSRSPMDGWSSRRRDLYLTTHTKFTRDTHIHAPAGFEPTITESERPQAHALDRADIGIGKY